MSNITAIFKQILRYAWKAIEIPVQAYLGLPTWVHVVVDLLIIGFAVVIAALVWKHRGSWRRVNHE